MYNPRAFREARVEVLHEAIRACGAGTVVSHDTAAGLLATHVPVELDPAPAPWGTLRCHMARANPHPKALADGSEVLVLFQGPQHYISPNWYPTKAETGRVVPTWNYVAVQARGTARTVDDPARLRAHLAALTAGNEAGVPGASWTLEDAPADFIEAQMRAIVGVEIALSGIEGKWKLSQNRAPADRQGVAAGLRALDEPAADAMAALVEGATPPAEE